MDNIKDALLRMVRAARNAKRLQETYLKNGLDDNAAFQIYGDIADGIYYLIGEHTETFDDSATHRALTVPAFDDEHRVRLLMIEYKRNFPQQPAPRFMSREKMFENVRRVGGYSYQNPEGDWT